MSAVAGQQETFDDYEIVVRFSARAMSESEAYQMIQEAVMERIDGHLLYAQRSARVVSVELPLFIEIKGRERRREETAEALWASTGPKRGAWAALPEDVREHWRERAEAYL